MKKISIIIPNYNSEKFICHCLNSILEQDYSEKEVIVVDDGSTDNSVKVIRQFLKQNKKLDAKLICQENLNAAVARNNGMKEATGDYVLFLDSDDLLEANVLADSIKACEDNGVDLLIGGYEEINEKGDYSKIKTFSDGVVVIDPKKEFSKLSNINPVPSNKIYNLGLIRKNNLDWGNVKIGQDLNFFLKYLSVCEKVLLTNKIMYKYRIVQGSMTRTYDSRIFDIVNVFPDVEKFYSRNNKNLLYKQYIPVLMVKHFNSQLYKQIFYDDKKVRKEIMNYFMNAEKKIDYSLCADKKYLKKLQRKFWLKRKFRLLYTSSLYRRYKLWRIKYER